MAAKYLQADVICGSSSSSSNTTRLEHCHTSAAYYKRVGLSCLRRHDLHSNVHSQDRTRRELVQDAAAAGSSDRTFPDWPAGRLGWWCPPGPTHCGPSPRAVDDQSLQSSLFEKGCAVQYSAARRQRHFERRVGKQEVSVSKIDCRGQEPAMQQSVGLHTGLECPRREPRGDVIGCHKRALSAKTRKAGATREAQRFSSAEHE